MRRITSDSCDMGLSSREFQGMVTLPTSFLPPCTFPVLLHLKNSVFFKDASLSYKSLASLQWKLIVLPSANKVRATVTLLQHCSYPAGPPWFQAVSILLRCSSNRISPSLSDTSTAESPCCSSLTLRWRYCSSICYAAKAE